MIDLITPVSYQGGKHRIADQILDIIKAESYPCFVDLCCGSGAITIALINRGYDPACIGMVDAGPWGILWQAISDGTFDVDEFRSYIEDIPTDPSKIQAHMEYIASLPVGEDAMYVYPILQAAAFGGKAIWIGNDRWQNTSFRSHWKPTTTSSRRYPVNPMMPMPGTLLSRMENIAKRMRNIAAVHKDVRDTTIDEEALVYVDPPYQGTTGYFDAFDVVSYSRTLPNTVWVSEGKPLSRCAVCISTKRDKGGISGIRSNYTEEWISKM